MSKNIHLSILSFMIVAIMSACTQDNGNDSMENNNITTSKNNETYTENKGLTTDEQESIDRLEKGILLYGEGAKGGNYLTRVNSANLEETNPSSIVVNVTIKNVRGEKIDLSELKYHLNDEKGKNSYNGKVLSDKIPSEVIIQANESRELNISFDVSDIADEYMFSVESSIEPMEVRWKIDNL